MLKFNVSEDKKWLILVECNNEIHKRQLEINLTKKIDKWFFHPLVKKKLWDGNICFIDKKSSFWKVPIGLWSEVLNVGKQYDIEIKVNGLTGIFLTELTLEEFTIWVEEFFKDNEKQPRDYQIEAAWRIIKFRYSISEIATSSGKTLIAFIILAFLKTQGYIDKFLMVAPKTNLVFQGNDDFIEYGIDRLEDCKVQQIGGGSKLREGCNVIIGTFQSLVKRDDSFFEDVDAVFVDEAHHTDTMSIKKILSKCVNTGWRFGMSGTLTKRDSADHLTIQQYLGPLLVEIPPEFLFQNKYATPVEIKVVILDWLDEELKLKLAELKNKVKNDKEKTDSTEIYNIERRLVIESKKRFDYIVDFINRTTKNSLVLFQSVKDEYGKKIYNTLREINGQKEVFYVDGDTDENLREEYKSRMSVGENKVLIATYGTFATGISIDNLHNLFFVESYKSEVLIKQSLGRGMRLMEGKDKVVVIDFVDDFSTAKYVNYLMKHSSARIQIYENEKFIYKIYKVKL